MSAPELEPTCSARATTNLEYLKDNRTSQSLSTTDPREVSLKWKRQLDEAISQKYEDEANNTMRSEAEFYQSNSLEQVYKLLTEETTQFIQLLEPVLKRNKPTEVDPHSVPIEELEKELIETKLKLAQVLEETLQLEHDYAHVLRPMNEECPNDEYALCEKLEAAKQRIQKADAERDKLYDEIQQTESQLFSYRRKYQHLLEEYKALEGDWN
eukprot:jgi/Galph1/3936/GphlegSOOS_G2641.1